MVRRLIDSWWLTWFGPPKKKPATIKKKCDVTLKREKDGRLISRSLHTSRILLDVGPLVRKDDRVICHTWIHTIGRGGKSVCTGTSRRPHSIFCDIHPLFTFHLACPSIKLEVTILNRDLVSDHVRSLYIADWRLRCSLKMTSTPYYTTRTRKFIYLAVFIVEREQCESLIAKGWKKKGSSISGSESQSDVFPSVFRL